MSIPVIYDTAVKVDLNSWPFTVVTENELQLHPLSIVFATGGIPKKLMVPGVDQYWGKGIGICTICDAPFNKGQDVAVVGGGDTSAERALQLSAYAKSVLMIVRESELDAIATVQKYLKSAENIKILYNTEIVSIEGNNKTVTKIDIINNKTGEKSTIPLNAVYFAIGYHPNSDLVNSVIKTDKDGYIVVQCNTQRTIIPGFYAAGIVSVADKPYGKSGVAAGSGIKAAMDVITFLENVGLNPDNAKQLEPKFFHVQKTETSNIKTIKSLSELQKILQTADGKFVLLYMHAPMCPSCRSMQPIVQALANQHADTHITLQAEHDDALEIIEHFNIARVPYFLLFKNGKIIWQDAPATKKQLIEALQRSSQEDDTVPGDQ